MYLHRFSDGIFSENINKNLATHCHSVLPNQVQLILCVEISIIYGRDDIAAASGTLQACYNAFHPTQPFSVPTWTSRDMGMEHSLVRLQSAHGINALKSETFHS